MSSGKHNRLIVIVGPTAVGKTRLSLQLAVKFQTEIVSADSRQIFRELTIGTAKPNKSELAKVKHHFINHRSIQEPYDAGQFGEEALDLITELFKQHDELIMCGGSGLYVKSVLEGFDDMPDIPIGLRDQIINNYEEHGLRWLQAQVRENDPDYFEVMDNKNPQRLMRALEIIQATGKPASIFRKNKKRKLPFEVVKIGLELNREDLYQTINERVDQMIANGLAEEVKQLFPHQAINALQTVGYQEVIGHLNGEYDMEEAIRLLKRNTRRYAKRQLTWFKKDAEVKWFEPADVNEIIKYLDGK